MHLHSRSNCAPTRRIWGLSLADRFDRETRSRVMSRNRSRGTKSTELRLRGILVRSGIRGWQLGHSSKLPGRPDIVFFNRRIVVFVDGCFWHGCHRCRTIPKTNRAFWVEKIAANQRRDKKATRSLRKEGWCVVRIWEHDLRNGDSVKKTVAKLTSN